MKTIINRISMIGALFVLGLQGLVHGQQPKERDFCEAEVQPGIDVSWIDPRFLPLVNLEKDTPDSFAVYEIVLDFEFQNEKIAALLAYRLQGNFCIGSTYFWVDGSLIKKESKKKRFDYGELGNQIRQVADLGEMTILKQCHLYPETFRDTRTLLVFRGKKPVLLMHMVGGHELYFTLEQNEKIIALLNSYLKLKSKML